MRKADRVADFVSAQLPQSPERRRHRVIGIAGNSTQLAAPKSNEGGRRKDAKNFNREPHPRCPPPASRPQIRLHPRRVTKISMAKPVILATL